MQIQNKEQAENLVQLMSKVNYFTKLKTEHTIGNSFSVSLKVSSYYELNRMVSDLLTASITLLHPDAKSLSGFTKDNAINVMTLLEIALQLLPEEEMELLDDLHKVYLKSDTNL
ncbi:hypothetical protein [Flavobacterium reichenbachii]|uniref:Uncharacterized protein n=1 Tax=Flavobacterium reichenbachii TaxID=362418 RepID=A0A085ZNU5_9FLAO|nr:hypothetical protein [Flavobacterium reichenbachii]KFF06109.1 hypothetical protein IW19_11470 [Flavobacterium reichenbachii]OXB14667.1 hypothetical protein B0A68_11475 [Flavobacterium reichenbachii]